jgi:tetratricopeptide (TPR) repeat protein
MRRASAFTLVILGALLSRAQAPGVLPASKPALQLYYDAAQTFQANGDLVQASLQYQLFIANALDHVAIVRGNIGDHAKSFALFNEALRLAPSDRDLQIDSAEEALASKDYARARILSEKVLAAEPGSARAHRILGSALVQAGKEEQGAKELERAVAIEPDFANGYALASAYLALKDKQRAVQVFREMQASFRDKAALHMQFGLAYVQAGFPDDASREFQKAIEEVANFPGAHYSLGASYLLHLGEIDFARAAAEFEKELQIDPDDSLSHAELGYIDLTRHRNEDAERELTRAAVLNPLNPDVFLWLGQLYSETGRNADAETALRKSISLTSDVSHNHYQVQRAHYLLARLLLQNNRVEDGKREMQISQELLSLSVPKNQGRAQAMPVSDAKQNIQWRNGKDTGQLDPQALSDAEALEKQLGPAIADSYNNLGAISATSSDFAAASDYFEKDFQWNPALDGLDYNWGKAAYSGHQFAKAVGPLSRYLESHPNDISMRAALGVSLFFVQRFGQAAKTLDPIVSRGGAVPAVTLVYAQALVETGDYDSGIAQLKGLIANEPQSGPYHRALGQVLARRKDFSAGAEEFRTALQIDSSDAESKYYLALMLVQLRQTREAQQTLQELAQSRSQNPGVYYQLGKLQLEEDDVKSAVLNLQEAVALSPGSEDIHRSLAAAYRKESRPEDADREAKLAETIHDAHNAASQSPHED